ncbi:MAG: SIS domain-containing protein [Clostridia bacterium]
MTQLLTEILSQPKTILNCFRENIDKTQEIARVVREKQIKYIVTAARGTSDNACTYFKYLCEVNSAYAVSSASPSVLTVYGGEVNYKDALVIGVSQSGQAQDVLAVLSSARAQGAVTVAITNFTDSPMAQSAQFHLYLNVGEERALAATKTYTAQILVLTLLCDALCEKKDLELGDRASKLLSAVCALESQIEEVASKYADIENCYILGRGYAYPLALECALKMMETTYVRAHGFAISDFYHGPFAVVDGGSAVVLLAPSDETLADSIAMYKRLQETDARVIVFSDSQEFVGASSVVKLPKCSSKEMPYAYLCAMQLFVEKLAIKKGRNADSPRGLKKVTITK